jgi:hypothetical protein
MSALSTVHESANRIPEVGRARITVMARWLRPQRLIVLLVLLFSLAGSILLYVATLPPPLLKAYEQIQEGMTLEELGALLGKAQASITLDDLEGSPPYATIFQWSDGSHRLTVHLRRPSAVARPLVRRAAEKRSAYQGSYDGRTWTVFPDAPSGSIVKKEIVRRHDRPWWWLRVYDFVHGKR